MVAWRKVSGAWYARLGVLATLCGAPAMVAESDTVARPQAGVAVRSTRSSMTTRPRTPAAVRITGVVVAADGGQPIAGAIVGIAGGASTRSDEQGAWTLSGVPLGTLTLSVRALRYTPQTVTMSVVDTMRPLRLALVRVQNLLDTTCHQGLGKLDWILRQNLI